ncbi:MAG: glucose-1-phosphate thymidylyltransferase [Proteobacteria bacterium]|nr:glucose-1-phosphate thymidylyltransferase [Pseudomonadota bacterium]
MTDQLTLGNFVDLAACLHGSRFIETNPFAYVGKALGPWVETLLDELGVGDQPLVLGSVATGAYVQGRVYVAEGATIEPTAYVQGPCYIGPGAEIRHGAYIRGQVYIGPKAVVGHTTEVKGSIFFDHAKAGHFAYVGDSILGRDTNLGAGTKLANLPLRRSVIKVMHPKTGAWLSTGLHKFSAIMGDESQTGCNAVLSPGTLLMPKTAVLPCVHYRGTLTHGIAR